MFTGIIEELGRVAKRDGGRFVIEAPKVAAEVEIGDSVSVNGCCLTVTQKGGGWWAAEAVDETLKRSNLGALSEGGLVNLEQALRPMDRLGGHVVQGHVDGVGEVISPAPELSVRAARHLLPYVVEKGSITVEGVSLTVVEVNRDGFSVSIIPHTADATTLGTKAVGDRVNLEVDIIAKYTERLLGLNQGTAA